MDIQLYALEYGINFDHLGTVQAIKKWNSGHYASSISMKMSNASHGLF